MIRAKIREEIHKAEVRCRPWVEIVHRDRAKKLRAGESGGAVALFGHYVGFLTADGTMMSWLHRVESALPNGTNAVVIASGVQGLETPGRRRAPLC